MPTINGYARLGKTPELKYLGDGDDKQPVCELSVKLINSKKKKGAEDEYDDKGFWAQVNVWGFEAEAASKLLAKGDKVYIAEGSLGEESWPDKDDPEKTHRTLRIDCRNIFPVLSNLEGLAYKLRSTTDSTD